MAVVEINWKPSSKDLRIFAALQIFFFAFVAWILFGKHGSMTAMAVVMAISGAVGLVGLVFPAIIRPIYFAWMVAVFPIGWFVSHLILAVVFYLLFTPIGMIMKLLGKDPLERRFDRSATTYWLTRKPRPDASHYFRQF